MNHSSTVIHSLKMSVANSAMVRLTTLLQNGIILHCPSHLAIGAFLANLPDFDVDYLTDRVQTIFLDGDAIDDLEKPFSGPSHVVALSAAMPGLAGAIFRRNSICAALRKSGGKIDYEKAKAKEDIEINLKLFNVIAQEKGSALLCHGGIFKGEVLREFFNMRRSLIAQIHSLYIDNNECAEEKLLNCIQPENLYHTVITPETEVSL